MAFTPTPKTSGDLIRSADWNDHVVETQRLETHKVNRAGADTLQGPLTINGNLGLGVSPGAKLDVNGDIRVRGGELRDAGGTPRLSMPDNADLHLYDAGGTSRLTIADNGRLDLREHNGGVRISIATNGYVGINRTDPSYHLDVNGSTRVTFLDVNGDIRLRGGELRDAGNTARLSMPDNADLHLYDAGGTSRLTIADNGRLDLKEDNGGVRISIATNGLVGINRTDPSYHLDVNGSARVTSSLIVGGQSVSPGAKSVAVRFGYILHGNTIPLPTGFTQAQCSWLVSPRSLSPPQFDINENGANAQFRVLCYTSGRQVTCQWWQRGHASTPGFQAHNGYANYIIIGVK